VSFSDPAFSTPDDQRVPVTVMLNPTQEVLLELILARMREKYGAVDENKVTDHIFARGLDAYGDALLAHIGTMLPRPLFDSQCRELCGALGWQGGTYHQVLAEVKRLKESDTSRDGVGEAPSLRLRRGETDLLRWVSDDITRLIKEGCGAWRSCSGCHELNEVHDTGPYSHTFRCALGHGCSECGGIGAVWDTTDYQALADAQKGGV
jgi:hypothetical protein